MSFFSTSGGSGRTMNEYDFTLANGCRHFMYNLSKEGSTEIRVVPAVVNGFPEPLLDTTKGNTLQEALTAAVAVVDVVRFLGPNKASMLCPPPADGERIGPVHYFINTIIDTAENDPKDCPDEWLRWCGKGKDRPKAVISRPQQVVMVQGFLYAHKGRLCVDKEGKAVVRSPVVLMLNRSATNDMLTKISKPANNNALWGSENNQLGDPVSLEHGRIMKFTPYPHEHNGNQQTWYMAELGDEVPLTMEDAMSVWRPWEQILNYNPTLPEVGAWLAKAFNAAAVVRVFENHPTYRLCVTDNIRQMANSAMAPAAPVYGAPQPPVYNPPQDINAPAQVYNWNTARPAGAPQQPYPPVPESYTPPPAPPTDDEVDPMPFGANYVPPQQDVTINPSTTQRRERR